MIIYLILALAIILVLLLVDWRKLGQRWPQLQQMRRTKKPSTLSAAPKSSAKVGEEKKKSRITSDDWMAEEDIPEEPVKTAVSSPTSSEIETILAEADVHFRKGEMKAAENLYLQAASKDPRCSKAYSRLGVIYLEHGDNWEDAEEAFRQALKTDAQNGFILNNLGLVLYHQDKYADAIRHFEQAVRQDEFNAGRHANLGMAYMAMRQYAKAESSFKKALKLSPNEMEYKDLLNESIEKKKAHKTMIRR